MLAMIHSVNDLFSHAGCVYRKCNPEMVELLPLEKAHDQMLVKGLLEEFHRKTGSIIASELLATWPQPAAKFIKVLPLLLLYIFSKKN